MPSRTRFALLCATSLLAAYGCGQGPVAGGTSTIGLSTQSEPLPDLPTDISGPPTPWAEMSKGDRATWMEERVVPTMAPLFSAFDPERYGDFGCETCHGSNARVRGFAMPNASLPVLPIPETDAWRTMMTGQRHVFTFMAERVEIAMARTLGVAPYDPATQQGFGCFNCHTMAER